MKKLILVSLMVVIVLIGSLAQAATSVERFDAGVFRGKVFTFAAGDTVWGICALDCVASSLNMETLQKGVLDANDIPDARRIQVGQQVFFPAALLKVTVEKQQVIATDHAAELTQLKAEVEQLKGVTIVANQRLEAVQQVLEKKSVVGKKSQGMQNYAVVLGIFLLLLWLTLARDWQRLKKRPSQVIANAPDKNFAHASAAPEQAIASDSIQSQVEIVALLEKQRAHEEEIRLLRKKINLYEETLELTQSFLAANNKHEPQTPPSREVVANIRKLKVMAN